MQRDIRQLELIRNFNNVLAQKPENTSLTRTAWSDFEYFTSSLRTKAGKRFFNVMIKGYIGTRNGHVQLVSKNEPHDEL